MSNGNLPFETLRCLILGEGNKVKNLRMLKKTHAFGIGALCRCFRRKIKINRVSKSRIDRYGLMPNCQHLKC